MRLLLASASPRRRELLATLGVDFEVRFAEIDERPLPGESPAAYVLRLARQKAVAVYREARHPTLGADTAVVVSGEILGKPRDAEEARAMLQKLSGRVHEVYSGVALATEERVLASLSVSRVAFKPLTEEEIAAYIATGEPFDKAGGYAIQGKGAALIPYLEGSYSGVVGLPLFETAQLLKEIGIQILWQWSS